MHTVGLYDIATNMALCSFAKMKLLCSKGKKFRGWKPTINSMMHFYFAFVTTDNA